MASSFGAAVPREVLVRWSAAAVLVATSVYVAAIVPDAIVGWPMPPLASTRWVASLSVFLGAPALAILLVAMESNRRQPTAVIATGAVALFAVIAVINRVVQIGVLVMPQGTFAHALDLYAPGSLANVAEMSAWDLCLGVACLSASLAVARAAIWPKRFLAVTGVLAVAGQFFYLSGLLGIGGTAGSVAGMAVSVAAWVPGLTAIAAAALTSKAFRDPQDQSTL